MQGLRVASVCQLFSLHSRAAAQPIVGRDYIVEDIHDGVLHIVE